MYFQQLIAHAAAQLGHTRARLEFHRFEKHFARERKAVGVQTAAGDADGGVAGFDAASVEHCGFFDHANDGAADVVLAFFVERGHLRRLAADEGAVVFRAAEREAGDDLLEDIRLQHAGAKVIEKK